MRAHTTHHSSGYQHQLWTLTAGTRAELQHKHLQSWKLTKTPCNLPEKIQMWTIMWKDEVPHFSLCSLHPVNVIHSVMEETVRDDRDVIESWHYWGHPAVVSAGRTRHSWHCIKLLIYTLIFHSVCTPQTLEVLLCTLCRQSMKLRVCSYLWHENLAIWVALTHTFWVNIYISLHRFKTSVLFVCYLSLKPPTFLATREILTFET